MDLSQQYVYRVYLEKSFTQAARALFISQPALSAMITKLEKKIGFQIFDRTSHDLRLTPGGRIYIEYLENIMNEEKLLKERIWSLSDVNPSPLRVGGGCQTAYYLFPAACSEFLRMNPGVSITVNLGNNSNMQDLIGKLKSGQLDLILTYGPTEKGAVFIPIFRDRLIIAMHKCLCSPELLELSVSREEILNDTYSADRELEDLSILSGIPFLRRDDATVADFVFSKIFQSSSYTSTIGVNNAKNLSMHYSFLREGVAATLVFDTHLPQHFFDDPNIIYFIPKGQPVHRTLYCEIMESKKDDPILKKFIATIKGLSHINGLKCKNLIRD